MTVLGIETSSDVCSVGLAADGRVKAERSAFDSHIHSERLQTLVLEVLEEGGCRWNELSAVAVSGGPGSFTGLRIGMSSAKGFCAATGLPLVVVPSFDGIAAAAGRRHPGAVTAVCVDAKQQEWYVALYDDSSGRPAAVEEVRMTDWHGMDGAVSSANVIVTDKPEKLAPLSSGRTVLLLRDCCRGGEIALEGIRRAERKAFADLAAAEPMYLKNFVVKQPPVRRG